MAHRRVRHRGPRVRRDCLRRSRGRGGGSGDATCSSSVGSPPTPFSQNKQNEPAVAIDADAPDVVAAGANDEIDEESCAAGDPTTCPFTAGVGVSGRVLLVQRRAAVDPADLHRADGAGLPRARGLHRRTPGPIGTLPGYSENGARSDGDPALAFGPRPGAGRDVLVGQRLAPLLREPDLERLGDKESATFKGFEAIAVSRTDDVAAAAAGNAARGGPGPRLASSRRRRSPTRSRSGPTTPRRAASSATSTSAGPRSAATAAATPSRRRSSSRGRRTAATRGRPSRSAPPRTTGSTRNRTAARSAPTATGNVYVFGIGRRRRAAVPS